MKVVAHESLAWLVGKVQETHFDLELEPDFICSLPYILWEMPKPAIIFIVLLGKLGAIESCISSSATEMWPDAKLIVVVVEAESHELSERHLVKLCMNFSFSYKFFATKLAFAQYLNSLGEYWNTRVLHTDPKRKQKSRMMDEPNDSKAAWLRMLMAVPGVTELKAKAITRTYPSLSSLIRAYEASDLIEAPELIAELKVGSIMLGKALSKRVHEAFR